jgi:hypothetical protein
MSHIIFDTALNSSFFNILKCNLSLIHKSYIIKILIFFSFGIKFLRYGLIYSLLFLLSFNCVYGEHDC